MTALDAWDPLLRGPPAILVTPWDTFTLDSTTFMHHGTRYLVWAQHEPGIDTNSNLYIAPLASPTELGGPPVRIAVPTLPWEIQGFKVNDIGGADPQRPGFMTFSASATDPRRIGLLTAAADADLLDAASWVKSPDPVFVTSEATSVCHQGTNTIALAVWSDDAATAGLGAVDLVTLGNTATSLRVYDLYSPG